MKMISVLSAMLMFHLASHMTDGQDCRSSKDLPNFGCVSPVLYRGGQPTEKGINELARRGVKTIVNLRGEDPKANIEEEWSRKAGIKYVGVPMADWGKPKLTDLDEVLRLVAHSEDQPVFVHCRRGADRTGTVIAAYRISHDGWTAEKALEEAVKYRMGWWQFPKKNFIKRYYKVRMLSQRSNQRTK